VEQKWRLVGSVGREVAGGRAAVAQALVIDIAHEWPLHAWGVEVGRQLAVVGGDGNSAVAIAIGALSERAPGAVG
jgi:hypothetical protein